MYDSLNSRPKVDAELQRGLAYFLETTGAKDKGRGGNFTHTCPPVRITQEDGVVCSLMTIIRLILKLSGEQEPDATHWQRIAEMLRTFFDLWIFMQAEDCGAVRRGYMNEVLQQAAVSSGAGAPGPSQELPAATLNELGCYMLVRSTPNSGGAVRTRATVVVQV